MPFNSGIGARFLGWSLDRCVGLRLAGIWRRARLAEAAEHDLDRFDVEVAPVAGGNAEVGDVDEHVADVAATRAHEVMVGVLDVRVDADRAGADVEDGHLSHRLEVVDGLVHGLPRDRGHLGAGRLEQRLDRRVRVDAVEQAEDRLPLRGDPQPVLPEPGGELLDRLHGEHLINNCC